ncbi:hypothetical protein PanWU01x14_305100 [Parasponia andersonii]|uniref:Uncharacterized protein n=1 Tax=Parasponia andersonii TaxID=3476 RepID=A0A2P5ASB7_PARAD|nr:hypothetical protein PanWU01x14_305100 [Parasponia andersonii]
MLFNGTKQELLRLEVPLNDFRGVASFHDCNNGCLSPTIKDIRERNGNPANVPFPSASSTDCSGLACLHEPRPCPSQIRPNWTLRT